MHTHVLTRDSETLLSYLPTPATGDLIVYMILQDYHLAHQPFYSLPEAVVMSTHAQGSGCRLQIMHRASFVSLSGPVHDGTWN